MVNKFTTFLMPYLLAFSAFAYDSYEHIAIGTNGVKLYFPDDPQMFNDLPYRQFFKLLRNPDYQAQTDKMDYFPQFIRVQSSDGNEVKLSYGEIIAIAGDFVGLLDKTISEDVTIEQFEEKRDELSERFLAAFKALTPHKDNPFYKNNNLEYLRDLIGKEFEHLISSLIKILAGRNFGIHHYNASSHSIKSKIKDQWAYAKVPGYVDILSLNVDHFEDNAKISYGIGHLWAMIKARKAFDIMKSGKYEEAVAMLNTAYAMDAFAAHYLADLFSSGHLRTPRAGLLTIAKENKFRLLGFTSSNVGLMANAMHDEDNYLGLWVKNSYGEVWKMYGDGSYFDKKSLDNRNMLRRALQASIDEVYAAFTSGKMKRFREFDALKLIGIPLENTKDIVNNLGNHFPLFKMNGKWPQVRKSYSNIGDDGYQNITTLTGISSLLKSDIGIFDRSNFYSFLMEETIASSLKRNVQIECYSAYSKGFRNLINPDSFSTLKDNSEMILVDNKELQFHTSILKGDLKDTGTYYVIDKDKGLSLVNECNASLKANFSLGKVNGDKLVEIRGRVVEKGKAQGYSFPIVVYDNEGALHRLFGYKTGLVK